MNAYLKRLQLFRDWKKGNYEGKYLGDHLDNEVVKCKKERLDLMVILRHFFLGCGMRKYLIKDLMIRRQDPQAKEGPFPETRFSPYCVHHLNS